MVISMAVKVFFGCLVSFYLHSESSFWLDGSTPRSIAIQQTLASFLSDRHSYSLLDNVETFAGSDSIGNDTLSHF